MKRKKRAARRPRPTQPTVAATVREDLGIPWGDARKLCTTGRVFVQGAVCTDPATRADPGEVTVDRQAPKIRRGVLEEARILFRDAHVVVVNKPAGLLTVPYSSEKDTLVDQLRAALRSGHKAHSDPRLGVVHRIDKGTSGLLVFARNMASKRHLAGLFRAHTIERTYVAIAHGAVTPSRHESWLVPNRGDGLRGSWGVYRQFPGERPKNAQRSITHVRASRPLRAASELELELETGRQHQIRIHLAESGHPLVGEAVYIRDFEERQIPAPRPMLHALRLGFVHPATGEPMRFEQPPPEDYQQLLRQLKSD